MIDHNMHIKLAIIEVLSPSPSCLILEAMCITVLPYPEMLHAWYCNMQPNIIYRNGISYHILEEKLTLQD